MPTESTIDLVKELRLRAWARRNHVPTDERRSSWHPVVLDEMAIRDNELRIHRPIEVEHQERIEEVVRPEVTADEIVRTISAFVPLDPGPYRRRWDEAHGIAAPNLATTSLRVRTPAGVDAP